MKSNNNLSRMAEANPTDESNLTQDQLIQLLKEKRKELDKVKKRLSKTESKYVEMHETKRLLQQDRDTFINFIQLVFEGPTLSEVLLPDD